MALPQAQDSSKKFITKDYLLAQLRAFKTEILDQEYNSGAVEYSIQDVTASESGLENVSTRYQLFKKVGEGTPEAVANSYIDIPKEYFLQNVGKVYFTADAAAYANDPSTELDNPDFGNLIDEEIEEIITQCPLGEGEEYSEGDLFLKFEIFTGEYPAGSGNVSVSTIYVSLKDIVPEATVYTAGDGIVIDSNTISVKNQVTSLPSTSDFADENLKIVLNEGDRSFYELVGESGNESWEKLITLEVESDNIDWSDFYDNGESGLTPEENPPEDNPPEENP